MKNIGNHRLEITSVPQDLRAETEIGLEFLYHRTPFNHIVHRGARNYYLTFAKRYTRASFFGYVIQNIRVIENLLIHGIYYPVPVVLKNEITWIADDHCWQSAC